MLSIWDHLAVLAFAIALPVYARQNYPKFVREVASGAPDARARQYRKTTVRQWLLTLAVVGVWLAAGRSWRTLGLGVPSGARFWIGLGVAAGLALAWRRMFRAALADAEGRQRLIDQLRTVEPLLPSTPREVRYFTILSLTAGICEEILFRGFLIWYLTRYFGLALACAISAVAFGLGHLYQGRRQAVKIVFVGLVFVLFYVGTGTLWIPMALHALLDAAQGRLAFHLLSGRI